MKKEEEKLGYGKGLQILPKDEVANLGKKRDLSHTAVFGAVKSSDLVDHDFDVATPLKIKNQYDTDFCSGFATSEVNEDQEGIEFDPLWQFAHIKKQMKDFKSWGADLRSAGMALVNFGSLPQSKSPFTLESGDRDFLANWENWPAELEVIAAEYKKKSMFFVDGPNDVFDNIRGTMWKNRLEKRSVIAGVMWRDSWTYCKGGIIPHAGWENDNGKGHCVKIFGQVTIDGIMYLKVQNSWGDDIGDKGIYYFPRLVINEQFAPYGQITFKDMPVADARYYQENGITVHDNWFVAIIKSIWNFGKLLFNFKTI